MTDDNYRISLAITICIVSLFLVTLVFSIMLRMQVQSRQQTMDGRTASQEEFSCEGQDGVHHATRRSRLAARPGRPSMDTLPEYRRPPEYRSFAATGHEDNLPPDYGIQVPQVAKIVYFDGFIWMRNEQAP